MKINNCQLPVFNNHYLFKNSTISNLMKLDKKILMVASFVLGLLVGCILTILVNGCRKKSVSTETNLKHQAEVTKCKTDVVKENIQTLNMVVDNHEQSGLNAKEQVHAKVEEIAKLEPVLNANIEQNTKDEVLIKVESNPKAEATNEAVANANPIVKKNVYADFAKLNAVKATKAIKNSFKFINAENYTGDKSVIEQVDNLVKKHTDIYSIAPFSDEIKNSLNDSDFLNLLVVDSSNEIIGFINGFTNGTSFHLDNIIANEKHYNMKLMEKSIFQLIKEIKKNGVNILFFSFRVTQDSHSQNMKNYYQKFEKYDLEIKQWYSPCGNWINNQFDLKDFQYDKAMKALG